VYLVGLTGGIAAGKSTVAARWVELGAREIDADLIAREVVMPASVGLSTVISRFGQDFLREDGTLNRSALGTLVFADEQARKDLEAILHPLVKARTAELIANATEDIVIYTVPLLVEANVDHNFDYVVTVEAPEAERVERLIATRGMTREQATARIRAQASAAERANHADFILNSNQPLQALIKQADALYRQFELAARQKSK
jgi:dephospho-CoA kinase